MNRITGIRARNLERAIGRGDYPGLCPLLDRDSARAWFGDETHFAAVEYPGLYPVHLCGARVSLRSCWIDPGLRGQSLREDLLNARLTWVGQWDIVSVHVVVTEALSQWWLDRGWESAERLPAEAWSAGQPRLSLRRATHRGKARAREYTASLDPSSQVFDC